MKRCLQCVTPCRTAAPNQPCGKLRTKLIEDGVLELLFLLHQTAGQTKVVANTIRAFANVLRDNASVAGFESGGGVKLLVSLCKNSKDEEILGNVASALANLAGRVESRLKLLAEGVAQPLIQLCSGKHQAQVLRNSAGACNSIQ